MLLYLWSYNRSNHFNYAGKAKYKDKTNSNIYIAQKNEIGLSYIPEKTLRFTHK